jgi:transcriptional regulator with XRE-family HTH domain
MDIGSDIGPRVEAWMQHRRLNQKQLARKVGISRAMVCQIIGRGKHKTNPSQETLNAIVAKGFEITLETFYGPLPTSERAA